ncbi:MAG TPA: YopX family protein [Ktedonobacteraceae bacterium]|nr:YopX family protein [Ktedonobacteraceae bacterium]
MREIKFRGWDKDTERWYYGSYVRLERTTPYPMSQFPEEDKKKFEDEQVDHYIFFTEMNDWGLETKKLRASVDPKSVGQYTGLKDNNRVEIWEGDVVRLSDDQDYLVDWSDGGAYFHLIGRDDEIPNGGDRLLVARLGWIEIIGNIYDNPELFKKAA